MRSIPALGLAALMAAVLPVGAQQVFDATADFDPAANPSGCWVLGYAGSFGELVRFPDARIWIDGIRAWGRDLPYPQSYPLVFKNTTGTNVINNGLVVPAGLMGMHPGNLSNDRFAVVRFNCPVSGHYLVTARFSSQESAVQGTTDVHVLTNGVSVFNQTVSGFQTSAQYESASPHRLAAGDTIDFVIGNGGDNFNGDSSGVVITVNLTDNVTPPALSITADPVGTRLLWPAYASNFVLQATPVLPAGTWTNPPVTPALSVNGWSVTLPATNPASFYRLRMER